jgi:hypothetical protein
LFEAFDATLLAQHPDRIIIEQEVHGRVILNIVACEGLESVQRAEPHTSWQGMESTSRVHTQVFVMYKKIVELISKKW